MSQTAQRIAGLSLALAVALLGCRHSRDLTPEVHPDTSVADIQSLLSGALKNNARASEWFDYSRSVPDESWRELALQIHLRHMRLRAAARRSVKRENVKQEQYWQERGAINYPGRTMVTEIAADGQTLLVGNPAGGIFMSQLGTESWIPLADGLGPRELAVIPGPPETWLLVGYPLDGAQGDLFVSDDKGQSWEEIDWRGEDKRRQGDSFGELVVDPLDKRTVYAVGTFYGGIYRSDDLGESFKTLLSFHSRGPQDFRTSRFWIHSVSGELYVVADDRLYRSSDRGDTFVEVGSSPVPTAGVSRLEFMGSAAGSSTLPTLYLVFRLEPMSQHRYAVYASEDGGANWKHRSTYTDATVWGLGATLAASDSDPESLIIGGILTHRSTDGGHTIEQSMGTGTYEDGTRLHVDVMGIDRYLWKGEEAFFVNTDGGTYISRDAGASYENITLKGFPNAQYYDTITSTTDPERIFSGAQDQGLQETIPGSGPVFDVRQILGGDFTRVVAPDDPARLLYTKHPTVDKVFRYESEIGRVTAVPLPNVPSDWRAPLAVDPESEDIVYWAAEGHIYRVDTTPGSEAVAVYSALPVSRLKPSALAISPFDSERWLLDGRYFSTDRGKTWQSAELLLDGESFSNPYAFAFSPDDPLTVWLGGNGYHGPGVLLSSDGGETWTGFGVGLPKTFVNDVEVAGDGTIYAATDAGPYRFHGASKRWESIIGTEAPITWYMDVDYIDDLDVLRFATYGRGIWDYSPKGLPLPPGGEWHSSREVPGFEFQVRIDGPDSSRLGRPSTDCISETLCIEGAVPGRSEVFLRVVGPKPNGRMWPTLVKFSTSQVEIWVKQVASGVVRYYELPGARPGLDELPGMFDRDGFSPNEEVRRVWGRHLRTQVSTKMSSPPDPPAGEGITSPHYPGYRFWVRISTPDGEQPARDEAACVDETICVSGAVPGRPEVFLRLVGPKPNGKLWPTLVRFSTSSIEVWMEQESTGTRRYYRLPGAAAGENDLTGLFDRDGFVP